jgi:hypothetical protein
VSDRPTQFSVDLRKEMDRVCQMPAGPAKDAAWKAIQVRIGEHYKPRKA